MQRIAWSVSTLAIMVLVIGCGKEDEPAPVEDSAQTVVEDNQTSNEGTLEQPPADESALAGGPEGGEPKVLGAVGNALFKAFSKASTDTPDAAAPPSAEP